MYKVTVDNTFCKGCKICSAYCPQAVFQTDKEGKPIPVKMESCTGCRLCVMRCPDFSIEVEVVENV